MTNLTYRTSKAVEHHSTAVRDIAAAVAFITFGASIVAIVGALIGSAILPLLGGSESSAAMKGFLAGLGTGLVFTLAASLKFRSLMGTHR